MIILIQIIMQAVDDQLGIAIGTTTRQDTKFSDFAFSVINFHGTDRVDRKLPFCASYAETQSWSLEVYIRVHH